MDLSRAFMEVVVIDGWVDRHHKEKEPGIEIGLGLFDLFVFCWAFALFCDLSFYALEEKHGNVSGKFCPVFSDLKIVWFKTIAVDICGCLREVCMTACRCENKAAS